MDKFSKNMLKGISALVLFIVMLISSTKLVEINAADEIMVIQTVSGELKIFTDAGPKAQLFGNVTTYKKSFQYWFDGKHEDGGEVIPIKFSDGGHATIPGSVRVDMPLSVEDIRKIHIKYGSQSALQKALIANVLTKSVYFAGPTMTSKESYAEKKNDLLYYVEDQAAHGIYKTSQKDVEVEDPITNTKRIVTQVNIEKDSTGLPKRVEHSLIEELHINLNNLTFSDFSYDDVVKKQISTQQQALMQVQTAIAKAKEAEQEAITTEQQGKAAAAKAKWEQEVIKAQAVTEAQQEKEVAALQAQTAILNAQKVKTDADAESYKNQKMVSAGLTPQQRAEYQMKTQIGVAEALSKIQLPSTYMAGGNSGEKANMLESILGVKLLNVGKE